MNEPSNENQERSKWEYGILAVSIGFIIVLILAIPWSYYYKSVLYWDDGPGIAAILSVLAVLNCLSLIFRLQIIEEEKLNIKDTGEYHVTMAYSTLANIFFWAGIAMWFVYKELHLSRLICFLVTLLGAGGHTLLHFSRWRKNRTTTTVLIFVVYVTIAVGLIFAYFTGSDFN